MPYTENIQLIYDDQCPLCRTYCKSLKTNENVTLSLIDARKQSPLLDKITAHGLDIDQGIAANINGVLHYGSDAVFEIAIRSQKGWRSLPNRLLFNTKHKASIIYPLAKTMRNILLRILDIDDIHNLKPKNTLKNQLGANWHALHPNIQKRFENEPDQDETIIYDGVMHIMRRSFMGWLFATLTRIIGNPLTSYQGTSIPVTVTLFKKPNRAGVYWKRTYLIPNQKPYNVVSSKQENKEGEMLECVGGGFGMKLQVYTQNQSLHFKSYQYFWKILKFKIPFPHWLTPGETHVIHTDKGNGNFTFTISMNHKLLGETFYQHGTFHKRAE